MKRDGIGRSRPVQMGVPASGVVGEQVGVVGELTVRHIRGGQVIFEETDRNLITNSGLSQFAKLAIGWSRSLESEYDFGTLRNRYGTDRFLCRGRDGQNDPRERILG